MTRTRLRKVFWSRVDRSSGPRVQYMKSRCWFWVGSKFRNPKTKEKTYGHLRVDGKLILAHRLSWELHRGKTIPSGKFVLHKCDQPSCVRPDHLRLGTPKTNMRDMILKGRQDYGCYTKLTEAQESEIRSRYVYHSRGSNSLTGLAREFSVSAGTIHNVVRLRGKARVDPSKRRIL